MDEVINSCTCRGPRDGKARKTRYQRYHFPDKNNNDYLYTNVPNFMESI